MKVLLFHTLPLDALPNAEAVPTHLQIPAHWDVQSILMKPGDDDFFETIKMMKRSTTPETNLLMFSPLAIRHAKGTTVCRKGSVQLFLMEREHLMLVGTDSPTSPYPKKSIRQCGLTLQHCFAFGTFHDSVLRDNRQTQTILDRVSPEFWSEVERKYHEKQQTKKRNRPR